MSNFYIVCFKASVSSAETRTPWPDSGFFYTPSSFAQHRVDTGSAHYQALVPDPGLLWATLTSTGWRLQLVCSRSSTDTWHPAILCEAALASGSHFQEKFRGRLLFHGALQMQLKHCHLGGTTIWEDYLFPLPAWGPPAPGHHYLPSPDGPLQNLHSGRLASWLQASASG